MNEIIAKLAKKNKIDIGIDISRINKLSPFEKTRILGRIKQNIKLSKKNDVKILVIGADSRESMSFIKILGGDTKRVKILL
jgi:RNase P/RNase MRP subunit p30